MLLRSAKVFPQTVPLKNNHKTLNVIFLKKNSLTFLHWYGFSPEWVLECCFSNIFRENRLLHWSHLWGFTPNEIFSIEVFCIFSCQVEKELKPTCMYPNMHVKSYSLVKTVIKWLIIMDSFLWFLTFRQEKLTTSHSVDTCTLFCFDEFSYDYLSSLYHWKFCHIQDILRRTL